LKRYLFFLKREKETEIEGTRLKAATLDNMQDWVRLKNANAGESILLRAKQKLFEEEGKETNLFRSGVLPETFSGPEKIPGLPEGMPGFVIHGVLSPDECSALINAVPVEGKGFMGIEQVKELYRGRIVSRYVAFDEELSQLFQSRLVSFLPQVLEGLNYAGISPEWRFLHYENGGHQESHLDGREKRGDQLESRLTIQLYLNDQGKEYSGGELLFYDKNMRVKHQMLPKAGDCAIFFQEPMRGNQELFLVHEACKVTSGHKFAARTVVEYFLPKDHVSTDY
jgi:predicted 2-oxoglutarate/Fe(II)-dependent dioxygenase YbiX